MIRPGLYRTTSAYPLAPDRIPNDRLVYVGQRGSDVFVVIPHRNERNRWFWQEPVAPLTDELWASTLMSLPPEGFYSLPKTLEFANGGRWLENAVVQLGYNRAGRGILFIAEQRESSTENILFFSSRGQAIDDELLARLKWAPILLVSAHPKPVLH